MLNKSRRSFLTDGIKGMGVFSLASGMFSNSLKSLAAPPLSKIEIKDFTDYTDNSFKVYTDGFFAFDAKLQDVIAFHQASNSEIPADVRKSTFSIKWRIVSNEKIEDGIYTLVHPAYGNMQLFFCNLAETGHDVVMETAFN